MADRREHSVQVSTQVVSSLGVLLAQSRFWMSIQPLKENEIREYETFKARESDAADGSEGDKHRYLDRYIELNQPHI
jgi:hypothetical protein